MTDHRWPSDPAEHVWSRWMALASRRGTRKPTQYRTCIHPDCSAHEEREAPSA